MESIINFKNNFESKIKVDLDKKFKQGKSRFGHFSNKKILLKIFILYCFTGLFSFFSISQSVEERQEYYKKMMSKGETTIKSFNTIKGSLHNLIFSDEHDGYDKRTEFQCTYEMFLVNFFQNFDKLTNEFNKMNKFNNVPEMSYLKQMNSIQDRKLSLLSEGIKFYEEISSEINSKPFKRWETKVIDDFVANSKYNGDFELYKRLRPVAFEIFMLVKLHYNISYLKCSYKDWSFMLQYFQDISYINPLHNYNMINHKIGFNNKVINWVKDDNLQNITNSNFDYSKIIFTDYSDNKVYSSWVGLTAVKDLNKDNKGLYNNEVGNSINALSLVFLVKSLDFRSSMLDKLFSSCNLPFKECTYTKGPYNGMTEKYAKGEYNYYSPEYDLALQLMNNDSIISYINQSKELIKLLYSIFPDKSPLFYADLKSDTYIDKIQQFDTNWFKVYKIKRNLITASCYLISTLNDLEFNDINSSLLKNWFNQKMDANKLKAYYQNEYMLKLGKTESNIWATDLEHIESILNQLRLIKLLIKEDINGFQTSFTKVNTIEEFDKFIRPSASKNIANVDELIISENLTETYTREIFSKYKEGIKTSSGMNSLGWRCLYNNQLKYSEKYLLEGLKISKKNPMITCNLAHVYLFNGDFKRAKKLYTKFPLDQEIPELKMNVRTAIKMDFEDFIKNGKDPKIFEVMVKELGL